MKTSTLRFRRFVPIALAGMLFCLCSASCSPGYYTYTPGYGQGFQQQPPKPGKKDKKPKPPKKQNSGNKHDSRR